MKKILLLTFLVLISNQMALGDDIGQGSASFLSIPPNARAMGMGKAFSAMGDDVSSFYWNTAAISKADNFSLMISHYFWVYDLNYDYIGMVIPLSYGSLGISGTGFWSLPIQGYDSSGPTGEKISYNNYAFKLGYGFPISDLVSFGLGVKLIYQQIYTYDSLGVSVDFGFLVSISENFNLGFSIKDLGKISKFEYYEEKLYFTQISGLAYKLYTANSRLNFLFAFDHYLSEGSRSSVNLGMETEIVFSPEYFSWYLRGGYEFSKYLRDTAGLGLGSGLRIKTFFIDYSFDFLGELGNNHQISVNILFGGGSFKNRGRFGKRGSDEYNETEIFARAENFKNARQYTRALAEYYKIYQKKLQDKEIIYCIASVHSMNNSIAAAVEWVNHLLSLDGSLIERIEKDPAFENLRISEAYRGTLNEYKKKEKEEEYNEEIIFARAAKYMESGQYDEALSEYLKIIKKNVKNIKAAYNITCIYSKENKIDNSIMWLDHLLGLDSSLTEKMEIDTDLQNIRNTREFTNILNKYKKPVEPVNKVEKRAVSIEEEMMTRGDKYFEEKQYNSALVEYNKIIKHNPRNVRAAYQSARIYSIVNQTEYANMWINYVLSVDSTIIEKIKTDAYFNNIRNTQKYKDIIIKYQK